MLIKKLYLQFWIPRISIHISIHRHTHKDTHIFEQLYRGTNTHTYTHTYIRTHALLNECADTLAHAWKHTQIYAHWTYADLHPLFANVSHQTRLDTRSKARRPIEVGIKGRERSGTSRYSNRDSLCCSSAHLVQCEPDEPNSFTNPNVGPGTYAGLWLKLDSKV